MNDKELKQKVLDNEDKRMLLADRIKGLENAEIINTDCNVMKGGLK